MFNRIVGICMMVSSFGVYADAARVEVGAFSSSGLLGWEGKSLAGETRYSLSVEDGLQVLLADSDSSASGYGRKIKIDLTKTPYVNWRWKVDNALPNLAETTKAGDDYAARLYVVKSGGALIWKTKALNYVWSGSQQREVIWPNAFKPKNAVMLAARGVGDATGVWVNEKRNVREDFKKLFGKDIESIDAVAIMTDTDNSGLSVKAAYGDIYFTAD